jgi:hypothetical protein
MKGKNLKKKLGIIILLIIVCLYKTYSEPQITISSGKQIDNYWKLFDITNDVKYIDKVIEFINAEDITIKMVNEILPLLNGNEKIWDLFMAMELTTDGNKYVSKYDIEIMLGILIQDKYFSDNIRYLYSLLPDKSTSIIRSGIKSAAFWSLYSKYKEKVNVKMYIDKNDDLLKLPAKSIFNDLANKL